MKTGLLMFIIVTMIVGVLIGTSFGVLYAPRAGQSMRTVISGYSVHVEGSVANSLSVFFKQESGTLSKDFHALGIQFNEWLASAMKNARSLLKKI